jgi:hypothetical protein
VSLPLIRTAIKNPYKSYKSADPVRQLADQLFVKNNSLPRTPFCPFWCLYSGIIIHNDTKNRIPFSLGVIFLMIFLQLIPVATVRAGYLGGEITWECTPQGNFRFIMKLIRDCAAPGTFDDTLWITSNFPGYDSIGMVRMAINDITPLCDRPASAALSCATATQTGSGAL